MISYQTERLINVLSEIEPLLKEHYKEIAMYKDKIKFKPNYTKYKQMENAGMLHIATVRDDGELVGYCITFVNPHLHYSDTIMGVNDIIYINPEYRNIKVGKGLIQFVEKELKEIYRVDLISFHMKTYQPFDKLLEGILYDKMEYIYTKYIGD